MLKMEENVMQLISRPPKDFTFKDLIKIMEQATESRSPDLYCLLLPYSKMLIDDHQDTILNEIYLPILDQMFMTFVVSKDEKYSSVLLKFFRRVSPRTTKVICNEAIYKFAFKGSSEATLHIRNYLTDSQGEPALLKKLTDFLIASGNDSDAIISIDKYLSYYSQDKDAWIQLGDIYCKYWAFEKAKFCYEEALLLQPESAYLTAKVGELLCSLEEYEVGRKYLCEALVLDKNNTKYLWLLWYTCKKCKSDDENEQIMKICKDSLHSLYSKNKAIALIDGML